MSIILSISENENSLWASGPEGLFRFQHQTLEPVPQPEQHLFSSFGVGSRLFVGGLPHGIAFTIDQGQQWQAATMEGLQQPALCFAPHPNFVQNGIILAGTEGAGLLRSVDRGWNWSLCNFGLQDFTILDVAWAPPPPPEAWPAWEVVFAATETGIYRSPNGGLGWRICAGASGCLQTVAVAPDFHHSGIVLAGSEEDGLWRSTDGGHTFAPVIDAPDAINALVVTPASWLLSDGVNLWRSADSGLSWSPIPDSQPAFVLSATAQGILAGGEQGVQQIA